MDQLSELCGSDFTIMEYVLSLMKFVNPIGSWARYWALKRLNLDLENLYLLTNKSAIPTSESHEVDMKPVQHDYWTTVAGLIVCFYYYFEFYLLY